MKLFNLVIRSGVGLLLLSSLSGRAEPFLEIPELSIGQKEAMRCSIYEREQQATGFETGIELGVMRLVAIESNSEFPYEAQYFISEEASKKHDLYYKDRFPSAVSIVRVTDIFVGEEGVNELQLDDQQENLKRVLAYFQLVAGVPADSPDLFAYLLFSDAKGLSLNISFITQEGKVLGHSGLLYSSLRFACAGFGNALFAQQQEAPAVEEAPASGADGGDGSN
ncbi:hypothetical protein GW915_08495 [bacterium]|nr:hypothetical protein [bacterium]